MWMMRPLSKCQAHRWRSEETQKISIAFAAAFLSGALTLFPYIMWKGGDLILLIQSLVINAGFMAAGFALSMPVISWRSSKKFSKSDYWQPCLSTTLTLISFAATLSQIYVPVITPIHHFVERAIPMGHFGLSGFFVLTFLVALVVAPLVRLIDQYFVWQEANP